jgi:hypothetical protein
MQTHNQHFSRVSAQYAYKHVYRGGRV